MASKPSRFRSDEGSILPLIIGACALALALILGSLPRPVCMLNASACSASLTEPLSSQLNRLTTHCRYSRHLAVPRHSSRVRV